MESIQIRKVTTAEIEQLQKIGTQTFSETFSSDNSEENMTDYLESKFSTDQLKVELSNKESAFYFAILKNNVIGYLKINYGQSQTEMNDQNSLEIERIYVLSEFHRKKVGQLLYEEALQIAKKMKVDYVWLGVWENNSKAIRFYEKNGFVVFDKHIFKLGDDEQTDLMMKLQLDE